ncbi:MAG: polyhydroxyalkanoate synthesis repressor PhaR [Alphaproteobacteria bacterium]|nr:polyhydroxyalkanoate synthesis repressor PhaR [Alphaproteobacteria bacterium]MCB9984453.1 polyhydroxyalkanoate synthesis repressor PhaR [Micavibrio sp.]MCB1551941.1 polyhydroxyalkanoate synthesis repressor PhaR [Alphaproteobacteria bacterium]HPQ51566.1 polyhydroxyalkanoate synthesis repressor PhaR [Alphaproteobacteria bacterium]HRK97781.1 polyhydroxyalkanoate synthesis repressor PhaR [Alphaproteobacteria bacterium]
MASKKGGDKPTVIKKYANRRLYDTGRSSYVTLDDLCQMVKEGYDFVVYDAKSGDDLTRSVLTQIIVEQESKGGQNLLPTNFLRQLIGFYGNNMGKLVPNYLEQSINDFTQKQEQFREQLNKSFGGIFPMNSFEEMSKQNMALFEQTMKAFSNFSLPGQKTGSDDE